MSDIRSDTWMPLYPADYLKDTRHLSTVEHGAYFLLILHAWTHDGILPSDEKRLARIAGLTGKQWKESRDVILDFFFAVDGNLQHTRINRELERADSIIEQRRAAGKASAAARAVQRALKQPFNERSTGDATKPQRKSRPSQSQSQEEERKKEVDAAKAASTYAFEGAVIKLTEIDLARWRKIYHAIPDLEAELFSLDAWFQGDGASKVGKWFHVTAGSLTSKQAKILTEERELETAGGEMPLV